MCCALVAPSRSLTDNDYRTFLWTPQVVGDETRGDDVGAVAK